MPEQDFNGTHKSAGATTTSVPERRSSGPGLDELDGDGTPVFPTPGGVHNFDISSSGPRGTIVETGPESTDVGGEGVTDRVAQSKPSHPYVVDSGWLDCWRAAVTDAVSPLSLGVKSVVGEIFSPSTADEMRGLFVPQCSTGGRTQGPVFELDPSQTALIDNVRTYFNDVIKVWSAREETAKNATLVRGLVRLDEEVKAGLHTSAVCQGSRLFAMQLGSRVPHTTDTFHFHSCPWTAKWKDGMWTSEGSSPIWLQRGTNYELPFDGSLSVDLSSNRRTLVKQLSALSAFCRAHSRSGVSHHHVYNSPQCLDGLTVQDCLGGGVFAVPEGSSLDADPPPDADSAESSTGGVAPKGRTKKRVRPRHVPSVPVELEGLKVECSAPGDGGVEAARLHLDDPEFLLALRKGRALAWQVFCKRFEGTGQVIGSVLGVLARVSLSVGTQTCPVGGEEPEDVAGDEISSLGNALEVSWNYAASGVQPQGGILEDIVEWGLTHELVRRLFPDEHYPVQGSQAEDIAFAGRLFVNLCLLTDRELAVCGNSASMCVVGARHPVGAEMHDNVTRRAKNWCEVQSQRGVNLGLGFECRLGSHWPTYSPKRWPLCGPCSLSRLPVWWLPVLLPFEHLQYPQQGILPVTRSKGFRGQFEDREATLNVNFYDRGRGLCTYISAGQSEVADVKCNSVPIFLHGVGHSCPLVRFGCFNAFDDLHIPDPGGTSVRPSRELRTVAVVPTQFTDWPQTREIIVRSPPPGFGHVLYSLGDVIIPVDGVDSRRFTLNSFDGGYSDYFAVPLSRPSRG